MTLVDIDSLWKCEMCYHDHYGRCTNEEKCENHEKYRPAYRKLNVVDAVTVVRKPVVGYEGYYEVDQFGRVFSLDRIVTVFDGDRTYEKPLSGKQMKQHMHSGGYKVAVLTKDGRSKNVFVHRIVAEAFLPNPENLPMVNHKDEDKTNNFLENLEWCTAAYNNTYGKAVERRAKKLRGRESEKRVAVIQRRPDGTFKEKFSSITEAARDMNGSTSAISKVCKGERSMAYGYLWEYADDFCSFSKRVATAENSKKLESHSKATRTPEKEIPT